MSLKLRLKTIRSSITKTCNSFSSFYSSEPDDFIETQAYLDALTDLFERMNVANTELMAVLETDSDESHVEAELEKVESYRSELIKHIGRAKVLLSRSGTRSESNSQSGSTVSFSRLPKINLPIFSGDVLEWASFEERFLSAMHRGLDDVTKFGYLLSQLKGEAASLVSGLPLVGSNYGVAFDMLRTRYGSKKRVLRAHVRDLLTINCQSDKDPKCIRSFVDKINKNMRGLNILNVMSDDYEIFLSEILIDRVSKRVKAEWAKLGDDDMNLGNLLKLMEWEARQLEIVGAPTLFSTKEPIKQPFVKRNSSFS